MGKNVVRATPSKKDALKEAKAINADMKKRGIKREAYVCPISQAYMRKRTRKGFPIADKNYAICMRNIKKSKR